MALVATCGVSGLIEPTETRYAAIARAMLDGGDWLVPRLNGIPHFHKPPVAYWLSAGGMAALGANEWGARIAVALAAGAVLWCTGRIAARAGSRVGPGGPGASAGAPAPLILASSALFFALSRQLASDVFLAAAVAGFHAAWFGERSRRGLWPFVALGVGFMAKGPVVLVLTVLPVLLAAAWTRRGALSRPLASRRGWLLFALVALPWYLVCAARTPGLLSYFLGNQVWVRYATTEHQRGGPPWYFVPVLLGGALPWTWIALRGAARAWRAAGETRRSTAAVAGPAGESGALLLAWILGPFLFFSFSGSKLPAYLLPAFPAVAVLAARGMDGAGRGWRAVTALTLAALGSAAAAALVLFRPGGTALAPGLLLAGIGAAAGLLASAALAARARWAWSAGLALGALLALAVTTRSIDGAMGSPRALVELLKSERGTDEPVVEFAHFNAGLPFYLGETVLLLEVPRERLFVDERALGRIRIERAGLPALARDAGGVWILGPERATRGMLDELGLGAELRARWKGEALFLARPGG